MRYPFWFCGLALVAALPSSMRASLLVYEGFNYSAGTVLSAATPGAGTTTGLNTSTAYSGTGAGNFTVQAASLSFGDLTTSGGSVLGTTATSVAAAKLQLASPFTGTLWSSYLVSLSTTGSGTGDGALLRVSDNNSNLNERFISFADSRSSSTNVAVAYDATSTATGKSLLASTTYIIIAKFTNVGVALSGTTTGQSTVWALTAAQFRNFILGGGTEDYLNFASVSGSDTDVSARGADGVVTSGTLSVATGNFFSIVSVNDTARFDELRLGTSLADVTPVPEPGSAGLAAAASALAAVATARRRRG